MKNLKLICLIAALLGLIISDPALARGGQGAGNSAGGGGNRGFSGGGHRGFSSGRHFRGSHRSFGGGRRHFRSSHRHSGHSHNRYNYGFNLGYYSPGYYGYRPYGYGYRPYGYGYRSYYRSPFYGYPSYYQRSVPSAQIVYVQREEIKPTQPQTNYWHYCRNPEGYYPYVKKCPEGWLQVAPQPAAQ